MSIMVGVGRGAGLGVLIKNAEALERMEKVDTLVVDKTGTLTEGKPSVTQLVPAGGFDRRRPAPARRRASNAPPNTPSGWPSSTPPPTPGSTIPAVSDFDSPTGKGVVGTVEARRVLLGSAHVPRQRGHRRRRD